MEGKKEEDVAREMGVEVNEEGEVVDKRELLRAGLNAEGATAARKVKKVDKMGGEGGKGRGTSSREKESRDLEEMLLGKHGLSSDEDEGGGVASVSKLRKCEDELLAGFGSP